MKEIKILHLFPRLLSLYGEYGNIAVLQRTLETNGCCVTVDSYENGELVLDGYDFVYAGAGTEDNLMEAVKRLLPHRNAIHAAIDSGMLWLATGNAMTLFGTCVVRGENTVEALGCFDYRTTIYDDKRYLGDVCSCEAFGGQFVGFINTSCVYEGISAQLLQLDLGEKLGNDKRSGAEGIYTGRFYGTQLIGPVLAKNPHFLQHICKELLGNDDAVTHSDYAQKAYDVALAELKKRTE